jgi:hypothetical protein
VVLLHVNSKEARVLKRSPAGSTHGSSDMKRANLAAETAATDAKAVQLYCDGEYRKQKCSNGALQAARHQWLIARRCKHCGC